MAQRLARRQILCLSAAAGLAGSLPGWALGIKYHRQRARQLTGIPCYDYQWGSRSRSEISTARAILLEQNLKKVAREIFEDRARVELMLESAEREQPILEEVEPLDVLRDRAMEEIRSRGVPSHPVVPRGAAPNLLPPPRLQPLAPPMNRSTERVHRPLAHVSPVRTRSRDIRRGQSLEELEIASVDSLLPADNLRVFQMDRTRLAIDHCMVSDVAVQLHREGCWVLSLRADQNPRLPNDIDEQFVYRPRLHLKRNEFHLRLRCYGLYNTIPAPRGLQAGRPMMADLHPVSFWVQRMEPRHLRVACCDRRLRGSFDRIAKMEVEFFYR